MARQMKDSGVEWIGQIPAEWKRVKLKEVTNIIMGQSPEAQDIKDFGNIPFMQGNREFGSIYPNAVKFCDNSPKKSRIGDILLSVRAPVGAINVSDKVYAIGRGLCSICATSINSKFLMYFFMLIMQDTKKFGQGSTFDAITIQELKQLPVLLPPINTQNRIASYLDRKCAQIDAIIAKQQQIIEKLKEYKLSVITEAVTKGLDPNVPMKDSGVEWIGKIPEHWEFRKIKNCCDVVDCKNRTPEIIPDGDYIVVRTTCIKDGMFSYNGSYRTDRKNFEEWTAKGQPQYGDIFFTREAPMGEACLVPNEDNLCMGQRVMFFRPIHGEDPRFILYSIYGPLVREYIESKNKGSTVGHLKLGQVASLPLLYCAPEEQKKIANYLDEKCKAINELISCKQEVVGKLQQYKKSLIYEVVTGKKEV